MDDDDGLKRTLGKAHLLMFGIGGLIGAGIFTLSGYIIQRVGPWALVTFLLASLFSLASCLVYAEFASSLPLSGGGYSFVRRSSPDQVAFLGGWLFFTAYVMASAFYALAFARYVYLFFGGGYALFVFAPMIIFSIVNLLGARESGNVEYLLVMTKVGILVVFSAFIIATEWPIEIRFSKPDLEILTLTTLIFIAFEGYDVVATAGEEAKNPKKDLPWAIIMTLILGTGIYLLVVYSMLAISQRNPWILSTKDHEEVIVLSAKEVLGVIGAIMMLAGVFISTLSAFNASFYAASRVLYRMGKDGLLPKGISSVSEKRGVPWVSIAITTGTLICIAIVVLVMNKFGVLDDREFPVMLGRASSMSFALAFAMVDTALFLDRRKRKDAKRPFKAPLYPITPAFGVVFALYALIETSLIAGKALLLFLSVLSLGLALRVGVMKCR